MLKTLFGRNATEDERLQELRKLNEALHRRAKKYAYDYELHTAKSIIDKPE